jgi:hypothetical protein
VELLEFGAIPKIYTMALFARHKRKRESDISIQTADCSDFHRNPERIKSDRWPVCFMMLRSDAPAIADSGEVRKTQYSASDKAEAGYRCIKMSPRISRPRAASRPCVLRDAVRRITVLEPVSGISG